MCLGIPGEVTAVDGNRARIRIRGQEALADASMVPVQVGDFVLVYAGLVVQVLEADDARERLSLLEEAGL
ncbi:MAG TPA: HypC/HybG/HupF family hydrogenase formation chaperone [Thermoplasmata archaeon]|jgi:hydrogenase expression/formation protein HypC